MGTVFRANDSSLDAAVGVLVGPHHTAHDAGTVDVWTTTLAVEGPTLDRLAATLSPSEQERAHRFRLERSYRMFVAGHSALRMILAAYVDQEPASLQLATTARGKPFLLGHPALRFNLSHSADLALVAVARDREVGVDIEKIDSAVDVDSLSTVLAPGEQEDLRRLPEGLRREAFFACWTRKEAYLKATGEGLRRGLASFRVTVDPAGPPRLVEPAPGREEWTLHSLRPGRGYVGTLVVEGVGPRVHELTWRQPDVPDRRRPASG